MWILINSVPYDKKLKSMDLIKSDTKISVNSIFNTVEALEYLKNGNMGGLIPDNI